MTGSLFDAAAGRDAPLADRMRPRVLDEIEGHDAVVGPGSFLRLAIERDQLPSLVLWGPPGSGKTTLARVVAGLTQTAFEPFSAVLGGVAEVRQIVARARDRRRAGGARTILFVDEIHRFNRKQQDAFLPHVEDGTVTLIGATTENPSFALVNALLSRCRVVRLESLEPPAITRILTRALADEERGLAGVEVEVAADVLERLAEAADGDARRGLGLLDEVVRHAQRSGQLRVTVEMAAEVLSAPALRHDRSGDSHYDVVSAFIKSLRGSDPDAALYYMARLIEGGDDPRFICRRMVIFAAEDVGNADPRALSVAVSAMQAYEMIGMPEGRIPMAQACTYLATAPKSNASYAGVNAALKAVRETGTLPVPRHIRNAPTKLMREMGHGAGYQYPHAHGGWVAERYLPEALDGARFYEPAGHGYERHIAERLRGWRDRQTEPAEPRGPTDDES